MPEKEPPSESEPTKSEKEIIWEKTRKEVDGIGDTLGMPIDEGIRDAVTAFNVNGFPTNGSCEGHADRALPVPWIDVSAPNEPEEKFKGQSEVIRRIAEEYGLSIEEIMRWQSKAGENAYWEAAKEYSQNEKTDDYKEWVKENLNLKNKAEILLKDFYEKRKAKPAVKLKIRDIAECFRIHNGTESDYNDLLDEKEEVSKERKQKRAKKLAVYKKEMDDFTEFLKKKFFEE